MNTLFIILLFCHWLGDFTHLSRPYMLEAKKFGEPFFPIFEHALVHAALLGIVVIFYFGFSTWGFACTVSGFIIMLMSHFMIDVLKGKLNVWFPILQDPKKYPHWYVFGLDQLAHILVILTLSTAFTQSL